MGDFYNPEYAVGQILVCPLDKYSLKGPAKASMVELGDDFFRSMGMAKSYEMMDDEDEHSWYIFKTPAGEEQAAIDYFTSLEIKAYNGVVIKPVDWAARRDLRMEKRVKDLEVLVEMAERLRDEPEESTGQYNKLLRKITDYITKIEEH
ncbi:hypothetical protein JXB28_00555 [Candidatus Woesearchaeota archaeon]|nr:hypothetical protein [Candidatus Woesearchaeota archaeon]